MIHPKHTRCSNLESFINHIGVPYKALGVIWDTSTITVKERLRYPLKLTQEQVLNLASLLQLPIVSILALIHNPNGKTDAFKWFSDQMDTFYVNYHVFYANKVTIRVFKGDKEIDITAMYKQIVDKHTKRQSKKVQNHSRLLRYSKSEGKYDKLSDQTLIFKATGNEGETPRD